MGAGARALAGAIGLSAAGKAAGSCLLLLLLHGPDERGLGVLSGQLCAPRNPAMAHMSLGEGEAMGKQWGRGKESAGKQEGPEKGDTHQRCGAGCPQARHRGDGVFPSHPPCVHHTGCSAPAVLQDRAPSTQGPMYPARGPPSMAREEEVLGGSRRWCRG